MGPPGPPMPGTARGRDSQKYSEEDFAHIIMAMWTVALTEAD